MEYEKEYKKLVDAIKVLRDSNPSDEGIQNWVNDNVPELKEDEDELTWLKRYIEEEAYYLSMDIRGNEDRIKLKNLQRSLEWLEKQREQKPQSKTALEPKFKVGEWIVWDDKCYKVNYNGCGYELFDQNSLSISLDYKTIEDNAHLWTIQDAKEGEALTWDDSNCIALFENVYSEYNFKSYGAVNHCTGKFEARQIYHGIEGAHPVTKEQHDLLFVKMKEAGYEWDAKKEELRKIEQKPADKVEPIFKPGDWIINTINNNVEQILKLSSSEYICSGHLIVSFDNQHLLRKWCIKDAKPGDILTSKDKTDILIFRRLDSSTSFSSYYNIKGRGELGWSSESFIPATKQQSKQLEKAMACAGYKWNQEKIKLEKL